MEGFVLKIIEYSEGYESQIKDYQLQDTTYTGLPQHAIAISKGNSKYHSLLAVTSEGTVPTFFVLDSGPDKFRYTTNLDSLLLRSFSTDDRYGRKGYALEALNLLPSYVKNNFPSVTEIVLGVNRKNIPAQKLYEKAGFVKQAHTIVGKLGEQFIYNLIIAE